MKEWLPMTFAIITKFISFQKPPIDDEKGSQGIGGKYEIVPAGRAAV